MRGIFNSWPSLPKYTEIWDVNIVFKYLSEQQCQTVHLIKQDNILIEDDKMYIVDLVKQTRPGRHIEPLTFHRYGNLDTLN